MRRVLVWAVLGAILAASVIAVARHGIAAQCVYLCVDGK